MEKGKLSNAELPHEIDGIDLPESFELTLDSYLMDPPSWVRYLASIIANALKGKDEITTERFMAAIESYLILHMIEEQPQINNHLHYDFRKKRNQLFRFGPISC
jgi:hypothetical protein